MLGANGRSYLAEWYVRNIDGVGAAVLVQAIYIVFPHGLILAVGHSLFLGQGHGLFDLRLARADGLNLLGADLHAAWLFAFFDQGQAAMALEHDPVARVFRQDVKVNPHPALTLGHRPGADLLALGSAQADIGVDVDHSVFLHPAGAKGAEIGAGRINAMHATPWDMHLLLLPMVIYGKVFQI